MQPVRQPTIPSAVVLLLIAVVTLLYSGVGHDAAERRYRRAASMPTADYVVDGLRKVAVGSGRSRHTEYLLALALYQPQPGAPQTTELRVAPAVYGHSHAGDHWVARVVDGEVLFDPDLSRVEGDNRMWLRVMALVFAIAGGAWLVAALRKR